MIAFVPCQDSQGRPSGVPAELFGRVCLLLVSLNENGKGNGAFYKVTAVNHTKMKVLAIIYDVKN